MPIYEYRCPDGHTFERFQSMTAPAPEKCDLCGASPVEIVLYPVAIHYTGSGVYTTDYGRSKAANKESSASGSADSGSSSGDSSKSDSKPAESKPASSSSSSSGSGSSSD